ncbi:MAG: deoxycytidylate deaminase [Bradyrhizobium sp.]|uniref:anti-phage dCTP deaminase n=1 Tax=Bradyrhizobium sp. TaxID=376 RepID=UPI002384463D|nr:anti-phage dCTP deaminase [Bradyrhizobium sp.]MDE2068551.1 deoxycytidylate deaminase [Bradyrhizobium sp.]MDE2240928.1 deoxycytidylate deaminase [Bradyrhizobium sp.]MDE2472298.1 deoxycytidylate deaminase [Bradyrhizobium sp.]
MANPRQPKQFPELIFGIVGPMGVDIQAICDSLGAALHSVGYSAKIIHLTAEMLRAERYKLQKYPVVPPITKDFYTDVNFKINYANALCKEFSDPATMARVGLRAIGDLREALTGSRNSLPSEAIAYVVRQLKRPEEVALFRKVYGRQFVLISAYGPSEKRQQLLEDRLRHSLVPSSPHHEIICKATELIDKDAREDGEDFGQNVRETFHLADVFIDGLIRNEMDLKLDRFIQALFGKTDIAPTKAEYGMYAAQSAALRSSDLSRQVGAAAFSDDGEMITQGCNEVPKAYGGTYWDTESPDFRDVKLRRDPNDVIKKELLRELFDRMDRGGLLSDEAKKAGSPAEMVEKFTRKKRKGLEDTDGILASCAVLDLTEFGRVVHAEMCAICDAARLGRSLKGSTLFVTTFPCHNCTKHILASGIRRVIYIEPYPKSRAQELHSNEISIERETIGKVSFLPFLGISPFRYRGVFQKGRRKDYDGNALEYIDKNNVPFPVIKGISTAYIENEALEWGKLVVDFEPASPSASKANDPDPGKHSSIA